MDTRNRKKSNNQMWRSNPLVLVENCICERKRGLIRCSCCNKTFVGRIAQQCSAHPETVFLMDFQHCGFCGVAATNLRIQETEIKNTKVW